MLILLISGISFTGNPESRIKKSHFSMRWLFFCIKFVNCGFNYGIMKMKVFLILIPILITGTVYCQTNQFALAVSGNYTTSSKIYPTPYSSDLSLRNNFFPLEAFYSPSLELFWYIRPSLSIGLSVELIQIKNQDRTFTVFEGSATRSIRTKEGFTMLPVELSLYYKLPFSTTDWGFHIYGGVAFYPAQYERQAGTLALQTIEQKSGYGIHVGVNGDYRYRENIFVLYGMKFRDPQVIVKSRYESDTFTYNDKEYRVGSSEFDSKINVDGVTFLLGFRYNFTL